jgi:2-methylcitrate dehydratase PrpD
MTGETETLARFAADLRISDVPDAVAERAKLLIFDTFGIMVRATHDAESTPSLLRAAARLGYEGGGISGAGLETSYTPPGAAMINGTLAHSLDFDDTHAGGSLHPSAPILPAALAAAEMAGVSGRDMLAAIIVGYEVQIHISLALGPTDHYRRGYHPSATCGAFGAAAAAGRLLGLDAKGMTRAFGIVLSQAAGSLQFLEDGAWTKRFQVGWAAQNGLVAATLAAEGFIGPTKALEGRAGFLSTYAPNPDPEKVVAGLGGDWETMNIAVKPYPSCRYSHAPLDALISLRAQNGINGDDVELVEVGVSKTGMILIGEPQASKQSPKTVVDGQFSMPFLAAVALRSGGMGWDDYDRHLKDPATLDLCRRITTAPDPKPEAEFPERLSGIVRIRTKYGNFEEFVRIPKGEPENFVSDLELRAKFDGLTTVTLSDARRNALSTALLSLEKVTDVGALMALTRSNRTAVAS